MKAVGIGEVVITTEPGDIIHMIGLGSCVGVFLSVPGKAVAAAHVLLPSSSGAAGAPPGKFADTAVPELVRLLRVSGFGSQRATATLVGGGQVLSFGSNRPEFDIGRRNAEAVRAALGAAGIRVAIDETGGTKARTARMYVSSGSLEGAAAA
jgi:chemotaxis protein CheD